MCMTREGTSNPTLEFFVPLAIKVHTTIWKSHTSWHCMCLFFFIPKNGIMDTLQCLLRGLWEVGILLYTTRIYVQAMCCWTYYQDPKTIIMDTPTLLEGTCTTNYDSIGPDFTYHISQWRQQQLLRAKFLQKQICEFHCLSHGNMLCKGS